MRAASPTDVILLHVGLQIMKLLIMQFSLGPSWSKASASYIEVIVWVIWRIEWTYNKLCRPVLLPGL
jgi:hypothetical protein